MFHFSPVYGPENWLSRAALCGAAIPECPRRDFVTGELLDGTTCLLNKATNCRACLVELDHVLELGLVELRGSGSGADFVAWSSSAKCGGVVYPTAAVCRHYVDMSNWPPTDCFGVPVPRLDGRRAR